MSDDALAHYGVKGMRWGVIKQQPSSGIRRKIQSSNAIIRQKPSSGILGKVQSSNAIIRKQSPNSAFLKKGSNGAVPEAKLSKKERKRKVDELGRRLDASIQQSIANPEKSFVVTQGARKTVVTGKEFTDSIIASNGWVLLSDIRPVD